MFIIAPKDEISISFYIMTGSHQKILNVSINFFWIGVQTFKIAILFFAVEIVNWLYFITIISKPKIGIQCMSCSDGRG